MSIAVDRPSGVWTDASSRMFGKDGISHRRKLELALECPRISDQIQDVICGPAFYRVVWVRPYGNGQVAPRVTYTDYPKHIWLTDIMLAQLALDCP